MSSSAATGLPFRPPFLATGGALILAALLIPGGAWEAVLGRAPGSLSWGPLLFRILLAFHGAVLALAPVLRSGSTTATARQPPVPWLPLTLMSVVAVSLRLIRLDTCLWMDEILAVVESIQPPVRLIISSFPSQNQHMFYSLLAHLCTNVFGDNFWAVRLPAVFFGLASLWALYFLGRKLFGNREALLACALLTVSYHHVWFSQNARGYTGLLFFTLLGTWLWLEATERRSSLWWLAYSIAGALGLWIHLTMAFVIASHGLISAVRLLWPEARQNRDGWQAFAFMFLSGTFALQLYALSLPEFLRTGLGEVSLPSEWTNPLWVVQESIRSLKVAFSGLAILLAGGLTVAIGWLGIYRRSAAAAWAFILPAVISGGVMLALGHNLWPRFFFFCMGFGLLIAIHGAVTLPSLVRIPQPLAGRIGLALSCVLIVASAATVPRCYRYPKQDFTGARDFVEQRRQPSERPVAVGLASAAYGYFAPQWSRPESEEAFLDLYRREGANWLIYTLPVHLSAWQPQVWQTVQRDFDTVQVFPGTLGDGAVYVCHRRSGPL